MSTNTDKTWHAVYVNVRHEKKVAEQLNERGIENYVPLVKTLRVWSDRKKMVELPLISGYVFVHVNEAQKEKVLYNKGVVGYVKSEGRIARVRDEEIHILQSIVALGYDTVSYGKKFNYKPGMKVKITQGILKNSEGTLLNENGEEWFEILLDSIGQCIRVKLPAEILIPLNN